MKSLLFNPGRRTDSLRLCWIVNCLTLCGLVSTSAAQDQPENIAEFLSWYCTDCHDSSSNEGDLDLASLAVARDDPDNFHHWERVFDRVREGEMPPDESLDEVDMTPFLTSLHDILKKSDAARIASTGRVPARRLTRAQYERNVCDLLAINIPLSDYLPEDSLTNGFDTVSKSQQISSRSIPAMILPVARSSIISWV